MLRLHPGEMGMPLTLLPFKIELLVSSWPCSSSLEKALVSVCMHGHSEQASHNGATVPAQCPLEADGGMNVLAAGTAHTLEELTEEQQDVPIIFG